MCYLDELLSTFRYVFAWASCSHTQACCECMNVCVYVCMHVCTYILCILLTVCFCVPEWADGRSSPRSGTCVPEGAVSQSFSKLMGVVCVYHGMFKFQIMSNATFTGFGVNPHTRVWRHCRTISPTVRLWSPCGFTWEQVDLLFATFCTFKHVETW